MGGYFISLLWMISGDPENFGAEIWNEQIETSSFSMNKIDNTDFNEAEEMNTTIEFDTSGCESGLWTMIINTSISKELPEEFEENRGTAFQEFLKSYEPSVTNTTIRKEYRLNNEKKLIEVSDNKN